MQSKLNELTEKIYQEGITKVLTESEKITNDAKREAHTIISNAHEQANQIIEQAKKEAEDLKTRTLSELKLSARQMFSDVKQQIINIIELKTIQEDTKRTFSEISFIGDIIKTIIEKWNPDSSESPNLLILLPESKRTELESYFNQKLNTILQAGIVIQYTDRIQSGFKISPQGSGYNISFTDEDFDALFTSYLRPKLTSLLFDKK
jgi:V/A-type H+-transporting ATPase subunit E